MTPLRTFSVFSSLSTAVAARRKTVLESTLAAESAKEAVEDGTSRPQLQLFAASFNGANHQYQAAQTAELLETLVAGHDEAGREADIVFLGLQEFNEAGVSLADHACEAALWPELTRRAGQRLSEDLHQASHAPPHLHGLKAELAGHLATFHGRLGAEANAFTQHYTTLDHDFHHHLSQSSHIGRLDERSRLVSQDVNARIETALSNVADYKTAVSDRKFDALRIQSEQLSNTAKTLDEEAITSKLAPIHEWTTSAMSTIAALRARYPNMALSESGEREMAAYLSSIDNVDEVQATLLNRDHLHEVNQAIFDLNSSITTQVEQAEAEMQNKIQEDLAAITSATEHLMQDVRQLEFDRHIEIARAASTGTEDRQAQIMSSTNLWASESREAMGGLLQPHTVSFTADHLDVKSKTETWNSGWRCHSGSHWDTTLHAFINPWSHWRIKQIDYSSTMCRKASRGTGCTMNNNVGWECGKVVNMQVFDATKDDETIRTCAMNTHMSFASTAASRLASISTAVAESEAAGCDSLVFVGDFNSRLHCHVSSEAGEVLPPYERLAPATNSSLNYLMEEFCRGGRCALDGPKKHWDELAQILESSEQLECHERDSTQPSGWSLNSVDNPIPAMGLREAGPVNFAPTYKMKGPEHASRAGHYSRCLSGEPTCYVNNDRKGKHNPAWTDRILLQNSDRVSVSTHEYSRRPVTPEYDTDHIPVVARVAVAVV